MSSLIGLVSESQRRWRSFDYVDMRVKASKRLFASCISLARSTSDEDSKCRGCSSDVRGQLDRISCSENFASHEKPWAWPAEHSCLRGKVRGATFVKDKAVR